ncbi:MAG: hypothetical protein Q9227_008707 [Pyrenula ochraceoflavens]
MKSKCAAQKARPAKAYFTAESGRSNATKHVQLVEDASILAVFVTESNVLYGPTTIVPLLVGNDEDKRCFEWFQSQTAKKIPGAFVLTFWDTLLFQASWSEPAVFHAVLTLSSVHKRNIVRTNEDVQAGNTRNEQERSTLQYYLKAISHLKHHFSAPDKASTRVALIACVIFVCLEFFRGNFETAQAHLQNGLKVLGELRPPPLNGNKSFIPEVPREPIDDPIFEALLRLRLQTELFKQTYCHTSLIMYTLEHQPLTSPIFHSLNEAWGQLERLLNGILHLAEQARQQADSFGSYNGCLSQLVDHQRLIQAELSKWLQTYNASKRNLQTKEPPVVACTLLHVYYTMASIMVAACLEVDDESIFDDNTKLFVSIVNQSAKMWELKLRRTVRDPALPGYCIDISRSIVDIGWIPPLYYTAIKCRVHRVRMQATRLLECGSHREAIWDSKIAMNVSRKIMEIEEGKFYDLFEKRDGFSIFSPPGPQDFLLPTLPLASRMTEVKVNMPDGPMDHVLVLYKQGQNNREWKETRISIQGRR